MQELLVVEVIPREKGRTSIRFDNGMEVLLYKGEVRKLSLREGTVISREKYIDDLRYATTYISYQQKKKSRQKLKMDLIAKGIEKSVIEQALDEVFDSDEQLKIRQLLEKKHYEPKECDRKEQQKIYQYLMRRGFKSSDILHVMKIWDEYEE